MSRAVLSVDAGSPVNWSVGALEAVFAWGRPTGPSFTKELMLLDCGVGEDSREFLGLQGDPTSQP